MNSNWKEINKEKTKYSTIELNYLSQTDSQQSCTKTQPQHYQHENQLLSINITNLRLLDVENGKEITIVDDQYRTPTYVEDLALACKISMDKKAKGIFNIASNALLSIYEISLEIANAFGLDESLIKPISTATLNQTANRPVKTGFDLSKTKNELEFHPKSFKEDLQRFKQKLI